MDGSPGDPKSHPWTAILREGIESLLRFVWPGRCAGCDALRTLSQTLFCESCAISTFPCGEFSPPEGIDQAFACFEYTQPVRHALHAWKYNGREPIGAALAAHMAAALLPSPSPSEHAHAQPQAPVCIIPVPMHPKRLQSRGFDQTLELARALARRAAPAARLHADTLIRARFIAPQVGLDAQARAANVADAFSCVHTLPEGSEVWLIDDVCTTGATATACALALRAANARRITLLALARAGAPSDDPSDGL